jgi:hypothetical protein
VEREWREARQTIRRWAKPSVPVEKLHRSKATTSKPAETGFDEVPMPTDMLSPSSFGPHPRRSGDPRGPVRTTGHFPQDFSEPSSLAEKEAMALVDAKAMALAVKYTRDRDALKWILWTRTNEFLSRNKGFTFESALDQVGREVETDLIYGRL